MLNYRNLPDITITLTEDQVSFLTDRLEKSRAEYLELARKGRTKYEEAKADKECFNIIQLLLKAKTDRQEYLTREACIEGTEPIDRAQAQTLADAYNSAWREKAREYILARLFTCIRTHAEKGYLEIGVDRCIAEFLVGQGAHVDSDSLRTVSKILNLKDELTKLGYDWEERDGCSPCISWAPKETTPCT